MRARAGLRVDQAQQSAFGMLFERGCDLRDPVLCWIEDEDLHVRRKTCDQPIEVCYP